MKSKEEIQELAYEIASLEEKISSNPKDKYVKLYMDRIENIIGNLSVKEGLELDVAVMKILNPD